MRAEIRVLEPDIVAITESWVDERISDEELHIEGYGILRKDRKLEIKGGGVILYVKDNLMVSEIELQNEFPEQLWCKLKFKGHRELLIGVCYRTPTENGAHKQVREMIEEVSNSDFILMGDFNYTGIDWINCCDSSASIRCF